MSILNKNWSALSKPKTTLNYIHGQFKESKTKTYHQVRDPTIQSTDQLITSTPESTDAEFNEAIESSKDGYQFWKNTSLLSRQRVMLNFQQEIRNNANDLAITITQEQGKTFSDAHGDVFRGLQVVDYASSIPTTFMGKMLEVSNNMDTFTRKFPLGVCAMIAPNNFPSMIPNWVISLAAVTGNSLILKPSERDPTASLLLAELAQKSGLPPGVLNIINGTHPIVNHLTSHPDIKAVSFVGGDNAGKHVYKRATENGKRVQVNMGAKNHGIILPDANKDHALNSIISAAFGAAGQRCMALSVAVPVGDARNWKNDLINKAKALKVGNGFDQANDMGPVISKQSKQRIENLINQSSKQGANIDLNGTNFEVKNYENGYFVGPTIISIPHTEFDIYKQEIFGPVLVILETETLDQAIDLINKNKYGNGASIFTESGSAARFFEINAEPGQIGINTPLPVPLPFFSWSGNKASFAGENSFYGEQGINFFTQTKTVTSMWKPSDQTTSLEKASLSMTYKF
ncbi:3-chloroallyl aldehyde dehydrogenase [Wallemia mellicola]|nr:3-chloroallyl aldehyde dehydrogenase [Wallemia mellicola]